MGLNSNEQRQLEERLSKRQMQDFMGVRLPSSPLPLAALKSRPSHPFQLQTSPAPEGAPS